jgi:hypothetical protein
VKLAADEAQPLLQLVPRVPVPRTEAGGLCQVRCHVRDVEQNRQVFSEHSPLAREQCGHLPHRMDGKIALPIVEHVRLEIDGAQPDFVLEACLIDRDTSGE